VAGVTAGKTVRFLLRGISQLRSLPPDLYRPYFRDLGMTEY
jgi:murein tripeptide amidase MpaA